MENKPATTQNTSLQNVGQQQTGIKAIRTFLEGDSIKKRFQDILGKNAPQFITSVITACNTNTDLQKCTSESIYGAALVAAALNLTINPNLGFAYIVPYKDGKTGVYSAQFQMGYKGFKQLAIRSGQFVMLHAKKVYEGQMISDNSFLGYHFDWSKKTSDVIVGYASNFLLTTGFESTFFMTVEEIEAHAKRYSQSYKSDKQWVRDQSRWNTDKEKMSLKTVVKLHLNGGEAPLSIEMQRAIETDQAFIDDNGAITYNDNPPIQPHNEIDEELETCKSRFSEAKTVIELDEIFSKIDSPDLREDIRDLYASIKQTLPVK